jgi:hypothetical protein
MKKYCLVLAFLLSAVSLGAMDPLNEESAAAPSSVAPSQSPSAQRSGASLSSSNLSEQSLAIEHKPPESLAQLAKFAKHTSIGMSYAKSDRTASCLVPLQNILNQEPQDTVSLTLNIKNNCFAATDFEHGAAKTTIEIQRSTLDLSSLQSLYQSLDQQVMPYIETWVVTDDDGRLLPLKEKNTLLFMSFLAKHLPRHLLLEGVNNLLLTTSDTRGVDHWSLPDLKGIGCSYYPTAEQPFVLTRVPQCIASANILKNPLAEPFDLSCPFASALPPCLAPYLKGDHPRIKMGHRLHNKNAGKEPTRVKAPFFEYTCGTSGGSADFPMQEPLIGHNPIAFAEPGQDLWGLVHATGFSVKVAPTEPHEDDLSSSPIHQCFHVSDDGTLYAVHAADETQEAHDNASPTPDRCVYLPAELTQRILKYLTPFDRLALMAIVPNIAPHVWQLGFEMPQIMEPNLEYGGWTFLNPTTTTRNIEIIQEVPGPYQWVNPGDGNLKKTSVQEEVTCQPMISRKLANFRTHLSNIIRQVARSEAFVEDNVLALKLSPTAPFGIEAVILKKSDLNPNEHAPVTLDNVSDDSIRFQVDPSMALRSIAGDLHAMGGRIDFWRVSLAWPLQSGVTLKMGPFYVKNIHDIDEEQKRYVGYEEVFKNSPFMMARLRQTCLEQIAEIFEDQRVPRLEGEGEGEG